MATITQQDVEHNKRVVEEFFNLAFNEEKPQEAVERYMGPYYIQHDTVRPDGKDGFIQLVHDALERYGQVHHKTKRILGQGDLVAIHSLITFAPEQARQEGASQGMAAMDILRLENGKIVEHWDVLTPVPQKPNPKNPNSFV